MAGSLLFLFDGMRTNPPALPDDQCIEDGCPRPVYQESRCKLHADLERYRRETEERLAWRGPR